MQLLNKMSVVEGEIFIKELDLETIAPSTSTAHLPDQGGSKTIIIGKPNTGKSTLIRSLLYSKKHIFPVATVFSGTERENGAYAKHIPDTFIFPEYNETQVKQVLERQRLAKMHLDNPWAILILDDCTEDPKIFNSVLQQRIMKLSRHMKLWYILSLQYAMDMKPVMRTCVDNVFILRETNLYNRKTLYENYAGIIPTYKLFCDLMDQITNDHTALYIDNTAQTSEWQNCVFWYKASPVPEDFKFGCKDYWDFHKSRYDPDYIKNVKIDF